MDLNCDLHPEVVAGKTGLQSAIAIYKRLIPLIGTYDGGVKLEGELIGLSEDENLLEHLLICKKFQNEGGKAFYLPHDFLRALSKMDNPIPVQYLPEKFIGYFHFDNTDNSIEDGEDPVEGAYVFIGKASEIGVYHSGSKFVSDPNEKTIAVSYVNKPRSSAPGMPSFYPIGRFCGPAKGKRIEEIVNFDISKDFLDVSWVKDEASNMPRPVMHSAGVAKEAVKERVNIYRIAINAALYACSAGADLMRLLPLKNMPHSKRKEWREKYPVRNQRTMPVTVLNWSYGQGIKTFSVDSTLVETHMRWQPCGPKWSQVKLIWVKEHERRYNKEVEHKEEIRV